MASGIAERLGTVQARLKLVDLEHDHHEEVLSEIDHRSALLRVIEILSAAKQFDVKAIGHRVVHGGEYFREAAVISDTVIRSIEKLADLAPLHNPPAAEGIRIAAELFPNRPQVAVFDTAFHQTLPNYAFHYAIPYEYYEKHRVRRYEFHGTSHHFVGLEAARRIGKPFEQTQFNTAHLGNGLQRDCGQERPKRGYNDGTDATGGADDGHSKR